ncbi:MAG: XRE family transcriptional regulator [Haliscomenobacteraceae bacterium CHB4]|nr:XRE family transcriptional regulator [Haliscomenobacteraceae bacterium CHB4]
MSDYGSYFKALREAKSLTLREVEKQTGISNAYLSQLETGKVKQPSPLNLHKLAQLYEVPYETLMEKVGYPVPQNTEHLATREPVAAHGRLGALSDEEELELLDYLKFIRNRRK